MHPIADRVFDVAAALVKFGACLMAVGAALIVVAVLLGIYLKP